MPPRWERIQGVSQKSWTTWLDDGGVQCAELDVAVFRAGEAAWYKAVLRGDAAVNFVENHWSKGWRVQVEGEVKAKPWVTKSGEKRFTLILFVERIVSLDNGQDTLVIEKAPTPAPAPAPTPEELAAQALLDQEDCPLRWNRPGFEVPDSWPDEWKQEREAHLAGERQTPDTGVIAPEEVTAFLKTLEGVP